MSFPTKLFLKLPCHPLGVPGHRSWSLGAPGFSFSLRSCGKASVSPSNGFSGKGQADPGREGMLGQRPREQRLPWALCDPRGSGRWAGHLLPPKPIPLGNKLAGATGKYRRNQAPEGGACRSRRARLAGLPCSVKGASPEPPP